MGFKGQTMGIPTLPTLSAESATDVNVAMGVPAHRKEPVSETNV